MTQPIAFPARPVAAKAFAIPVNAREFLLRYPQHIHNVLYCWSQPAYLSVDEKGFVSLPPVIQPDEVTAIEERVVTELNSVDVVFAYYIEHHDTASPENFFEFIHAYIYSFVQDREPAKQILPIVSMRTLQIVTA